MSFYVRAAFTQCFNRLLMKLRRHSWEKKRNAVAEVTTTVRLYAYHLQSGIVVLNCAGILRRFINLEEINRYKIIYSVFNEEIKLRLKR